MYTQDRNWVKCDTKPVYAINTLCPNCLGKECEYCYYFGTVNVGGGNYEFCPNIQKSITRDEYIAVFRDSHYLRFLWCLITEKEIIDSYKL